MFKRISSVNAHDVDVLIPPLSTAFGLLSCICEMQLTGEIFAILLFVHIVQFFCAFCNYVFYSYPPKSSFPITLLIDFYFLSFIGMRCFQQYYVIFGCLACVLSVLSYVYINIGKIEPRNIINIILFFNRNQIERSYIIELIVSILMVYYINITYFLSIFCFMFIYLKQLYNYLYLSL